MTVVSFLVVVISTALTQGQAVNLTTKLIWSQAPLIPLPLSHFMKIQGDPEGWISGGDPPVETLSLSLHKWVSRVRAVAYSFRGNVLVWSEALGHRIQVLELNTAQKHPVDFFTGTSSEVNGVAVDWINRNVYWTDALYDWVAMAPLRLPAQSTKVFKIVVQEGLDNPHGIALHPHYNWLLLSDWGVRPRIERMSLLGQKREVLVDSDIQAPTALVLDVQEARLFWLDQRKGTVESIFLRGRDQRRTVLLRKEGFSFYDLAFFKGNLFLTDQSNAELQILPIDGRGREGQSDSRQKTMNQEEGAEDNGTKENATVNGTEVEEESGEEGGDGKLIRVALGNKPYGIVMFDQSLQPGLPGLCDKGWCDQLCVETDMGSVQCLCGEGYDLMDDFNHCQQQTSFPHPAHVYTLGVAVCLFPAHAADMDMGNVSLRSQCGALSRNYGYQALAFHAGRDLLLFSATYLRAILAVTMQVGATPRVLVSGTGVVRGLAVDWVTGTLFWTDSSKGRLMAARLDGSFQTVVLQDHVTNPLGITLHPRRGTLYWTDLGSPGGVEPSIESANMDGSQRHVLVGKEALGQPSHLFLDYRTDRLYWADSRLNRVMRYDLNSKLREVFCEQPGVYFFGISLYKDYLLWTDKEQMNGVHMARVDLMQKVRGIIHPGYGQAADLITVDTALQPNMASPCENSQTLCDQLCLPRGPDNYTCRCGLGFELQGGMLCTQGQFTTDNFLLVTDASQRNVYHIDVISGVISAVTRGERHQPIAIDFLPGTPGVIFWSDNVAHVIRRLEIGHVWPSTFIDLPEDSKVDGLAVDVRNNLLYYTDTGRDVIGVADLGGPAPSRHAVVIREDLNNPRDIVVFAPEGSSFGKIYWTDWGTEATINEATMVGDHRHVLLSFNTTAWLNGLALDRREQILYWADAFRNSVGMYNLRSRRHRLLLTTTPAHFFGLFVMGRFLYLSDWRRQYLLRMPKQGGSLRQFGEGKFNKLFGVTGYNSSEVVPQAGQGVCADQSKCGSLSMCLPKTSTSFTCVCVLGHRRQGLRCLQTTTLPPVPNQTAMEGFEPVERHHSSGGRTGIQNLHSEAGSSGSRNGSTAFSGRYSRRTGVVVVAVTAAVVFCTAAGLGVFCFYKRRRSYRVPHARLGDDQPNAPPDRPEEGAAAATAAAAAVRVHQPASNRMSSGRMPAALAHFKVFYARRPSAEHVRFEEGFDNPSYDEAAMAMMTSPQSSPASTEDNQPTL